MCAPANPSALLGFGAGMGTDFGNHKTAHGIEMEKVHAHRAPSLSGSSTEHCKDHTWLLEQKFLLPRMSLCFYQFSFPWLLFQVLKKFE